MELLVKSLTDVDRHMRAIELATNKTHAWLREHEGTPLELLRAMKFDQIGCHPLGGHALNIIEQINQTFTYAVALAAAKVLLDLHPDAGGLVLAPGAHMSREFDIMSVTPELVAAETFAAVHPGNNRKLAKDLAKLAQCQAVHRYVFFASPAYPTTERRSTMEVSGVHVWSVALD